MAVMCLVLYLVLNEATRCCYVPYVHIRCVINVRKILAFILTKINGAEIYRVT